MARGATHSIMGNLKSGIHDLTCAIDLDPTLYRAYLWRAYAYVEQKDADRALIDVNHIRKHAQNKVILEQAEALTRELLLED